MKIHLEFDDDDKHNAKCAFLGYALWCDMWDIDQMCRNRMKHEEISDSEYKFLESIRERCFMARFIEEEM